MNANPLSKHCTATTALQQWFLLLSPPAASGPCLGALALVGVRGRPLCFCPPLFLPFFSLDKLALDSVRRLCLNCG